MRADGFPLRLIQFLALVSLAVLVALLQTASISGFDATGMIYIDMARHIAEGEGMSASILFPTHVPKLPSPISLWPPLYPATVAGVSKLGIDVAVAARLVSILSFGLSAGVVWLLGSILFGGHVGAISALLLSVWPPVATMASMALSENLFVLLILLSLLITVDLIRTRKPTSYGYVSAAVGGLAMGGAALTRYPGIALILVGAAALLLNLQGSSWKERLAIAAVWSAFAVVPPALLLTRNLLVTGALIGAGRLSDDRGFVFHALYAVKTVILDGFKLVWRLTILPEALRVDSRLVGLGMLGVLGVVLIVSLRSGQLGAILTDALRRVVQSPESRWALSIGVGYWGAMVVARSVTRFEPLNTRMMMPTYPLLLVGVVAFLVGLVDTVKPSARKFLMWTVVLLCVGWLAIVAFPRSLSAGGPRLRPGPAPVWVNWVEANTPPNAPIVGNTPFDINFYLQRPVYSFQVFGVYGTGRRFDRDCRLISSHLANLGWKHAYLILHAEDGRLDADLMGRTYGVVIERLLNGELPLPMRPIARYREFAAFEILDGAWNCNGS